MRLAAAIIDLAKTHQTTFHSLLDEPTPSGASKKEKVFEFLMTFAEEFDVSPDLVEPGAGYKRSLLKRSTAAEDFFESLPKKKKSKSPVNGFSATQPHPTIPALLARASTVIGSEASSPLSTLSEETAANGDNK